ncbi:MAG: dUTP diphosphatase [Candidatus Cloacimonetes bacterium]|nr:dUTP diphosphatase [Candidatus Cloacimonadota bacterium]
MPAIDVKLQRLRPQAILPRRMSEHAAGWDLAAALEAPLDIPPGQVKLIPSGIAISLPPGYEAQVRPRSGLALKHRVGVLNSPGTIDADYRGEVGVILYNFGDEPFTVEPSMRIAQMVVSRHENIRLIEVDSLDETARSDGGFGHTQH